MDKLAIGENKATEHWARFLLCVVLGSVLIYSSLEHLLNPYQFVNSVANYSIVSESWSYWIAFLLPSLQIMVGCLLFSRTFRLEALAISTIMFAVFAAAQTSAFFRGLNIECGCFGSRSASVGILSVTFVVSLFLLSAFLVICQDTRSRIVA